MLKPKKPSVQKHLKVKEIKDGLLVLDDGSLRAVAMVTSMNFALKGDDEKTAIITSFASFINAMTYPVQILVKSKKLDLDDYLDKLKRVSGTQQNPLLKQQIDDYAQFIFSLLEVVNIMDKDFFVVIPWFTGGLQRISVVDKVLGTVLPGRKTTSHTSTNYEQDKAQLLQRSEQVMSLLSGIGLRSVLLNTEELIELFYGIYNPRTSRREKLKEPGNYASQVIEVAPKEQPETPKGSPNA